MLKKTYMDKQKNYGFSPELEKAHRTEEDYVFGAFSQPCIADIPEGEREKYLPKGELQNIGEEKMDCASRGPINILETKFNFLVQNKKLSEDNYTWLIKNGYISNNLPFGSEEVVCFSDAFIAIKSGTTRQGNSLKAPLQAIHEHGLIPKSLLPQVASFNDYYNPKRITPEMEELGKEFVKRFPITYEIVFEVHFSELYKEDMLDLAGFAWPVPVNGEYPRTTNSPNHCFMGFKNPKHFIFDNYLDTDGDFIKKLASDYDLNDYGYRISVAENKVPTAEEKKYITNILGNILSFLKDILLLNLKFLKTVKPVPEIPKQEPKKVSLAELAQECIGKDMSPKNLAPQELSCAEGLSNIINKIVPDFPKDIVSSFDLYTALKKSPSFEAVLTPSKGCVIVSPRTSTVHGHCGVFISDTEIVSNDSDTGFMEQNYDYDKWIEVFKKGRWLHIYLFKLKV